MLYTLSQAQYDTQELRNILAQVGENDAVLLWQDGVLQAIKNPQLFAHLQPLALEIDVTARGLVAYPFPTISLDEFVALTEKYFPQIAL